VESGLEHAAAIRERRRRALTRRREEEEEETRSPSALLCSPVAGRGIWGVGVRFGDDGSGTEEERRGFGVGGMVRWRN
jgi:hypothetical protein